ncbi:MAG: 3-oxoacyl-ACP reductase family protein [Candidatus Omnitrophota bacterium]
MLKGRVALITGGSRGIGRAIALEFVRGGAKVLFTYMKNDEAAGAALKEIRALNGEADALKADVKDSGQAKKAVETAVSRFGRLDILVNNAGVVRDKALMLMEPQDWSEVIDTDLTGYYNMCRAAIVTLMKQRSGNILNISSVAGVVGIARQVNYSAAKAGILGLTKALAKEVGPYNIRVNAIAPGYIDTEMTLALKKKDELMKLIPSGRFGAAEEVAKTAVFLVSDRASYITGQVVKVDGGLVM